MIPILYEKNEASFTSNGLGRLRDCISCDVTEERNGVYECDFTYPMDGAHFDLITCGRIVGVTHEDSNDVQPFDIVSHTKPINGIVTFHCTHISYRQSLLTVKTPSPINSLADAFTLLGTSTPTNPFTYWTDKTSTGYLGAANGIPRTVRQLLGGIQGSILDAYGGEYEFDKWNVKLWNARGSVRDFSIRYGVNMTDYTDEMDVNGTYSRCIPYWTNGTDLVVGNVVSSTGSTVTGRGECVPLDCSESFENAPTVADLTTEATRIMANRNPFNPTQTIKVSFARLQDLGYDDLSNLYQCKLCDSVNVVFPFYNMTKRFKIVRTVWDVLSDRYDSMELGSLSVTLAQALGVDGNNSTAIINALSTKGGTLTGDLAIKKTTVASNTFSDSNPKLIFHNGNESQSVSLTFTDYDSVQAPASLTLNGNQGGEWFLAPNIKSSDKLYGDILELTLNTSAGSGTVDGNLYAAITALGWQSTVID